MNETGSLILGLAPVSKEKFSGLAKTVYMSHIRKIQMTEARTVIKKHNDFRSA